MEKGILSNLSKDFTQVGCAMDLDYCMNRRAVMRMSTMQSHSHLLKKAWRWRHLIIESLYEFWTSLVDNSILCWSVPADSIFPKFEACFWYQRHCALTITKKHIVPIMDEKHWEQSGIKPIVEEGPKNATVNYAAGQAWMTIEKKDDRRQVRRKKIAGIMVKANSFFCP